MAAVFAGHAYLRARGVAKPGNRLRDMAKVLGFDLDAALFEGLDATP